MTSMLTREMLQTSPRKEYISEGKEPSIPQEGVSLLQLEAPTSLWLRLVLWEDVISPEDLRAFACKWVERALDRVYPSRRAETIEVVRKLAQGEVYLAPQYLSAEYRGVCWWLTTRGGDELMIAVSNMGENTAWYIGGGVAAKAELEQQRADVIEMLRRKNPAI
jgi:hypothetical protein